jgi:hypothetical protein
MDAVITKGPRETYEDESYRGYLISYDRECGTFIVSTTGYRRGISSLRKDAKRWIDLLIDDPGFEQKLAAERAKRLGYKQPACRSRKTRT